MTTNKKISFLICGTQKGGTTALRSFLHEHHSLEMPEHEVHYFDNEEYFSSNEIDYTNYHSHFSNDDPGVLWGESTPIYMYWKPCPKRIFEYNPNMKLIVLLRDPADRAYSHWNMEFNRGKETLQFLDALEEESKRLANSPLGQHRVYSYIDRGHYPEQIERLLTYFDRSKILLINSSELLEKTTETVGKVTSFLGVSEMPSVEGVPKIVHAGKYETAVSGKSMSQLQSLFEQDLIYLENTLGFRCLQWDCK